jgi:hypothetical protein
MILTNEEELECSPSGEPNKKDLASMESPLPLWEIRMNVRMHSYELRRVRVRGM